MSKILCQNVVKIIPNISKFLYNLRNKVSGMFLVNNCRNILNDDLIRLNVDEVSRDLNPTCHYSLHSSSTVAA